MSFLSHFPIQVFSFPFFSASCFYSILVFSFFTFFLFPFPPSLLYPYFSHIHFPSISFSSFFRSVIFSFLFQSHVCLPSPSLSFLKFSLSFSYFFSSIPPSYNSFFPSILSLHLFPHSDFFHSTLFFCSSLKFNPSNLPAFELFLIFSFFNPSLFLIYSLLLFLNFPFFYYPLPFLYLSIFY